VPEIDVSDILLDPEIAGEELTILRRPDATGTNGVDVITETEITPKPVGSVRPTGGNSLVREDAYQQQAKSIRVITNFRLRGVARDGAQNYQPDIVVWGGSRFVVQTVEDYSRYGAGMIQADCMSQNFVDPPPA
jgi:hypothetical protein